MQGTEKKQLKAKGEAASKKWLCHKLGRPVDQDDPKCPDPELYCKHRTGCLVYHHGLLDD